MDEILQFLANPSPAVLTAAVGFLVTVLVILVVRVLRRRRLFLPLPPSQSWSAPAGVWGERRAHPRRRGRRVAVHVRAGSQQLPGWVVDRSPAGLGLQVPRALTVGDRVELLSLRAARGSGWVSAEVRHCRQLGPRHWHVGVRFLETIPPSTLLLFG
jgi:hypothetical protein